MKIMLVALGTAGDVFPIIGLGRALQKCGHDVHLASPPEHQRAVEQAGLTYHRLNGIPGTADAPDIYHPTRSMHVVAERLLIPAIRPVYELLSTLNPAEWTVIATIYAYGARLAQEKHDFWLTTCVVSPATLRSIHRMPVTPGIQCPQWAPMPFKRAFFQAVSRLWDRELAAPLNAVRESLGLPPAKDIWYSWCLSPERVIGLFPEWFAPNPGDWPPQFVHAAFSVFDRGVSGDLPPELTQPGDPLVVFVAGSAGPAAAAFFRNAVSASAGQPWRAVLLTGTAGDVTGAPLPPNVHQFDYVPLSRLLPLCGLVVHHGGLGALSLALAAGTPQLAVPFGHDQFDNAARIAQLGVGRSVGNASGPLQTAIGEMLRDPTWAARCRDLQHNSATGESLAAICDQIDSDNQERLRRHSRRDAFTVCNLCDHPGSLQGAVEKGQVPCDVRYFAGKPFTVWRCTNCKSIHSADEVDLPHYYSHYPLQGHKLDAPTRISYGRRLRFLEKHGVTRTSRILDYGCGSGVFAQFLREKGFTGACGYDAFVAAYADRQVLSESYDAVVSFDVIEHVADPKQFLSELSNLLRPQGLLLIGTPNANHLSVRTTASPDIELSQPYHRHILSEQVLLDLSQRCGLRPIEIYRKNLVDSLVPGINTRFMWTYIKQKGGRIDAAFEPPSVASILRSPALLSAALFGSLYPPPGNIVVVFRRA
jgi:rhamnosyltransferase subunit B